MKLGVWRESDGVELVGVEAEKEGRQGFDLRRRVVDFVGRHGCGLREERKTQAGFWAGRDIRAWAGFRDVTPVFTFFQNHWPTFQKEEIQPLTSVKVLRHVAYYVWYEYCEFHLQISWWKKPLYKKLSLPPLTRQRTSSLEVGHFYYLPSSQHGTSSLYRDPSAVKKKTETEKTKKIFNHFISSGKKHYIFIILVGENIITFIYKYTPKHAAANGLNCSTCNLQAETSPCITPLQNQNFPNN